MTGIKGEERRRQEEKRSRYETKRMVTGRKGRREW
jgi:hypothetical protein